MRAWQVTDHGEPSDVLREADVPPPPLGPGQVAIDVRAVALGLPDVLLCRGTYAFSPALPFTPGQEVCGVVSAVGPDATATPGDRVMAVTAFYEGHGGFADRTVAPQHAVYPAPGTLSDAEAAGFAIAFHTAHIALVQRGRLQPGETVLVHGAAGGTGAAAITVARALGATVIASAGGAAKGAACLDLGAHVAIDHHTEDVVARVLEETSGVGADIVFDPVGGDVFETSFGCLANEGRLLAIGMASGRWGRSRTGPLVMKNVSVLGVYVGAFGPDVMLPTHEALLALHREGRIHVPVAGILPFADIPAGLNRLGARDVIGKLVADLTR